MSAKISQQTYPEFCACNFGGVKYPYLLIFVIDSLSLQTLDIRSMSNLSLCVSPNDLSIVAEIWPMLNLLFVSEHFDSSHKSIHIEVERSWVYSDGTYVSDKVGIFIGIIRVTHCPSNIECLSVPVSPASLYILGRHLILLTASPEILFPNSCN